MRTYYGDNIKDIFPCPVLKSLTKYKAAPIRLYKDFPDRSSIYELFNPEGLNTVELGGAVKRLYTYGTFLRPIKIKDLISGNFALGKYVPVTQRYTTDKHIMVFIMLRDTIICKKLWFDNWLSYCHNKLNEVF